MPMTQEVPLNHYTKIQENFPKTAVLLPELQMARIKPKQLLIQSKTKKGPTRISYSTIITWNLIVVLVVISLYATYRHWHHRSAEIEMDLHQAEVMDTAKGSITIEIYKDASADVVDRFVNL